MNKIMKKISLFALICAGVFGFAVSSCSSDDKDVTVAGVNPETYYAFTNYISDVNDETGTVHFDYFSAYTYIDGANGNRYYLFPETILDGDGFTTLSRLEKAGILLEGNKVRFSGKVYDSDERWIPDLQWRLDNYGWNESAKEHQTQLELPKEGYTFWLVAPDFIIENAE